MRSARHIRGTPSFVRLILLVACLAYGSLHAIVARVGTAPLGKFTIDPTTKPKEVDSTALSGPDKGNVTRGIYEIVDANNKRACWGKPGSPRPADFTSDPGSGRTLQYWRLISKSLGK